MVRVKSRKLMMVLGELTSQVRLVALISCLKFSNAVMHLGVPV